MNLYLLRHGIAADVEHGIRTDAERPLTEKGAHRIWRVAEAMKAMKLEFDHILSSPLLRARQTAEIIADGLDLSKRLAVSECLGLNGTPSAVIELLTGFKSEAQDVLLVGHEPNLAALISLFISGESTSAVELKKGALCKLSLGPLRNGRCGTLEWLLTAKQMALMA